MICDKHAALIDHNYCVICALEDKAGEQIALWKEEVAALEIAWEQAVNFYPDLEDLIPGSSQKRTL